jgi:hypothetical protein
MNCKVSGEIEGAVDGGRCIPIAIPVPDFVEDFFGFFIGHSAPQKDHMFWCNGQKKTSSV